MEIKKNINEFLLIFYLWSFTLLKPVLGVFQDYSTIILFIVTLIIVCLSIIYNLFWRIDNSKVFKWIPFVSTMMLIFMLDIILRHNTFIFLVIYDFAIFGVIPILLYAQVKDHEKMLKYYVNFSIIIFIAYGLDPFNEYSIFGDYMSYGYGMAMPAYFGLYIGRRFFKIRWVLILEVCCFILIIVFANKGAVLSVVCFILLMNILMNKKDLKVILLYFYSGLAVLFISFNMMKIIDVLIEFTTKRGYYSYSLQSVKEALSGSSISILSGRDMIWQDAYQMITERPLIGFGTGAYNNVSRSQDYTHNFFLDVLIQYGFIGLLFFILLITRSLWKILFHSTGYNKIIGILFISSSFPKLIFSSIYLKEPWFWLFLFFGIKYLSIVWNDSRVVYFRSNDRKKGKKAFENSV
ncbi:O-antigen ligase family protein [Planococcus sp. N064]|uniref:O-antigen ligase family protein n=1 Tax=Planococcus liqunii TaxID=3058394 RepID=A0ABT8MNF2_9BACL|nr:O-antigen ligase family protein [Planococcus sp. N064]MDN7226400.1 O-antigen ligase family protein [Planococcus sp. N064]